MYLYYKYQIPFHRMNLQCSAHPCSDEAEDPPMEIQWHYKDPKSLHCICLSPFILMARMVSFLRRSFVVLLLLFIASVRAPSVIQLERQTHPELICPMWRKAEISHHVKVSLFLLSEFWPAAKIRLNTQHP